MKSPASGEDIVRNAQKVCYRSCLLLWQFRSVVETWLAVFTVSCGSLLIISSG